MGMHDIGYERRNGAPADFGRHPRTGCKTNAVIGNERRRGPPPDFARHPRKGCKTHAVIGPILAVRRDIGITRPRKEMRRIEHKQIEILMRSAEATARTRSGVMP